jgi:oxaloacetate decarboxylase (Na+ extruding) subunit alpha
VPRLVDTTIRLLGQEPLAGRVPSAELLEVAAILDRAGFAYLEVSGGGVFDSAVRRGVESPWERIRALDARVETPLALALRGRFLVGARHVGGDFVRRFVATASENGIDVFRLHDPLNDVSNLAEASAAIDATGGELAAGLVYGFGLTGETPTLVEQAKRLSEIGAARVLLHDPSGALEPHRVGELVTALRESSGLPVGIYVQGSGGSALAAALEGVRAGADLVAGAVFPIALTLHRVSGQAAAEAFAGFGLDTGVDVEALWQASEVVDRLIGDEPVAPLAPRVAVRAAEHHLPAGLVATLYQQLRAHSSVDRLDEVLDELERIRVEAGWPPLAAPIGQILGSQALLNVLSATRYGAFVDDLPALIAGRFGATPGPVDRTVARAVELLGADAEPEPPDLESIREEARGLASSDEEVLLLALFGDEAEPLLKTVRSRGRPDEVLVGGRVDQQRAELIREVVRIVQDSGVAEVTIEEAGMRVSVRRTEEAASPPPVLPLPEAEPEAAVLGPAGAVPVADGMVRVESPMVGTFYRSPQPGEPPFVEVGETVATGQTLAVLEAMKLLNELKSETDGVVRAIHADNAQAVEYGQLLFELEPLAAPPLDLL